MRDGQRAPPQPAPSTPPSGGSSDRPKGPSPSSQSAPWQPSIEWKLNAAVAIARAALENQNIRADITYRIEETTAKAVDAVDDLLKRAREIGWLK